MSKIKASAVAKVQPAEKVGIRPDNVHTEIVNVENPSKEELDEAANQIAEKAEHDVSKNLALGLVNGVTDNMIKTLTRDQLTDILTSSEQAKKVAEVRNGNKARKRQLKAIICMGYPDIMAYMKYCASYDSILQMVPEEERAEWMKKNPKFGNRKEYFLKPTGLLMIDLDHIKGDVRAELNRIIEILENAGVKIGLVHVTASGDGGRFIIEGRKGSTIEKDMEWFKQLTGVEPDDACKDFSRLSFLTTQEDIIMRDDNVLFAPARQDIYINGQFEKYTLPTVPSADVKVDNDDVESQTSALPPLVPEDLAVTLTADTPITDNDGNHYDINYVLMNKIYLQQNNKGIDPKVGNRNKFLFDQACDYRYITDFKREVLDKVLPTYGLSKTERSGIIDQALSYKIGHMSARMQRVVVAYEAESGDADTLTTALNNSQTKFDEYYLNSINTKRLPKSILASFDSLKTDMYMAVLTLLGPIIGFLATKVRLDVHGEVKCLNLESFIEGFAGSGKGQMKKINDIWCEEIAKIDAILEQQEDQWETRKREAEGSDKQPKEIRLPRRLQTFCTSKAKILQRLRDSKNQHIYSFSSEADLLSNNKYAFSDLELGLRYAYDNDTWPSDMKSVKSTNTTVKEVKWNVALCGTLDALYRLITCYRDGLLSRFCIAIMPDNRFTRLARKHSKRSEKSHDVIRRVAHLLPLMQGDVELPRIEDMAVDWVNEVCDQAKDAGDSVMAELRIRTCVSAMRYICCFMLLYFAEYLLKNLDDRGAKALPDWADSCETAEDFLKTHPDATAKFLTRFQTETMKQLYRTLADYFIDNAIYLFRAKMEESSMTASGPSGKRQHRGANDAYMVQLSTQFTLDDCRTLRGGNDNAARMMIRNWLNQKTIVVVEGKPNTYQKVATGNA